MSEGAANHPRAMQFSQQVQRQPPTGGHYDDGDLTETVIRKQTPGAIGSHSKAPQFASQLRTTMQRRPDDPVMAGVPSCLRLLPPDLLERWQETKPKLLARLTAELAAGHLKAAYDSLRNLLYDAPRLAHLLDDVFLIEAYAHLPEEAREAIPATTLKSLLSGDALPAFADFVDQMKQGDGDGCATAMAELSDLSPAAGQLMAKKFKAIMPRPTAGGPAMAPELRQSAPKVQAAFTPPSGMTTPTSPSARPDVAGLDSTAPAWLQSLGFGADWDHFLDCCLAQQWAAAWDIAEQLAIKVSERRPDHEALPALAEEMALMVAEGLQGGFVPNLANRLEPADLFPVLACGATSLLMGCNNALQRSDWVEALEHLGMMPEEGQLEPLIQVVLGLAWQTVPRNSVAQATLSDIVALWVSQAASGMIQLIMHLIARDRPAAESAIRMLAAAGSSNTKLTLLRIKLGWQTGTGALPRLPGGPNR